MGQSDERQHADHLSDAAGAASSGQGERPLAPAPDDVYRVLEDFESNLKGLKSLYNERQVIQARLQEREVGLMLREKELSGRAAELEQVRAQIEAQRSELERERQELASRESQVAARQQELHGSADQMEKGLSELRQKNEELKRWADEHDRVKAQLAADAEALAKDKAEVESSKPRIAQARKEMEQAARALAEVEQRRAELAAESKRVAETRADVESLQLRLQTAREEIEEARQFQEAVEKRRTELELQATRLTEERAKLDADAAGLAELRSQKALIEGELAVLDSKRGKAESLAQALATMEQSLSDQTQELQRIKVELAEARAAIDQRETGLNGRLDDVARLEGELAALREVVEEYEQLWIVEREHAAELVTLLEERSRQAAESAEALARSQEAAAQNSAAGNQAPAVDPAEVEGYKQEISQLEKLVGELKDRLRSEIAARREAEELAQQGTLDTEHHQSMADAKLEKALAQLSKAQAEIERLRSDSPSFTTAAQQVTLERRRERLRVARRLVREKQNKLKAGGEALRKRFEQCEEVFKQRSELSAVAERVKAADRRHQKHRAQSRVAGVVACWMLILGIMAGLSYTISRHVVPGVYVARTTLKADGRGRELTDPERREWQQFHEQMLGDPRFADAVAKRMARKGMAATSDAATVTEMMRSRLAWESPAPGELRLELTGSGSTNTIRELDTISITLAGEANAARTNQAHAAVTTPPTPAATGDQPLDNSQLIAAGAMLGVGFIALVAISMAMYKKLAQAKTRFERDAELASILDDANWPDMQKLAA